MYLKDQWPKEWEVSVYSLITEEAPELINSGI